MRLDQERGDQRLHAAACITICLVFCLVGCERIDDSSLAPAFDPATAAAAPEKQAVAYDAARHLLWGDLHVHTSQSYDAYTMGTRTLPDDAYTYMKGGTIEHALGYAIRARRPLDFGAVTDHAEYLGIARAMDEDPAASAAHLREVISSGNPLRISLHYLRVTLGQMRSHAVLEERFVRPAMEEISDSAWRETIAAAQRHDDPGRFTTFVAYEWTSMPNDENLHRNVIFASERVPGRPFSSRDSEDPEDLWAALEDQRAQGMDSIAIPHNGNVSNGRMYASRTFGGRPLDADYARRRVLNEPISEIFQVKGSSEAHPRLSSDDGFAGFELYEDLLSSRRRKSEPKGSYYRDALRTGLEFAHREGFNPFVLGAIGSSDGHNASSPTEEDAHHGKLPLLDGSAGLRLGLSLSSLLPNLGGLWSSAGLAAIYAEENTRASLFAAMKRRESYATSGPRIAVRFFGGFDYTEAILDDPEWIARAYRGGVPMGGELAGAAGGGAAPVFLIWAAKDPIGAHLDRIQIIKTWVEVDGTSREQLYDVAASDGRLEKAGGYGVLPVGNTVDVANATWEDSIGSAELSAVWRDPAFDAYEHALYYARVVEIPTPRHTTYAAKALGVAAPSPAWIQERAVTSAIWYRPEREPLETAPQGATGSR